MDSPPQSASYLSIISEVPFVIQVKTRGILSKVRSSKRSTKRKYYTDAEPESDDSDIYDEYDQESEVSRNNPRKSKKSKTANESEEIHGKKVGGGEAWGTSVISDQIEAPPSDVLPSLWYSRENCIHIWVVEKIIGWKTRQKVGIEWKDESIRELNLIMCSNMKDKLISAYISNRKKRMEISRICPANCPMVLEAVTAREERLANEQGREKTFKLKANSVNDMEEVLLIKWRGRSYIHCSWERPGDLEYFDPSSKGKINRYYQIQQKALGVGWRTVLENGGSSTTSLDAAERVDSTDGSVDDGYYFAPEYVEIERVLACDENQLDMNLLYKQRAINIQREKALEKSRKHELLGVLDDLDEHTKQISDETLSESDETWDPEDYVRYVVKWKGLSVADVTWEYWLHIKYDCVDQAEDFWLRQKVHDLPRFGSRLPYISEYKKLTESPCFGISTVKRHVAALPRSENETSQTYDDITEDVTDTELRLRAYQLEGVNWLLWNWWNRRSCILADEMGLGKTIQTVCFLDQLRKLEATQIRGPFLIVAPLSLVNQWQSEAHTWAPDMNVVLYHGPGNARKFLVHNEFFYNDQFVTKAEAQKLKRQHFTKFHILITTFEIIMKDLDVLSRIEWKALIVDEAHRLKNDSSRLFKELQSVPRDFCLLLTGTPLQNSTEELWSLLNFCSPYEFGRKDEFVEKFGSLSDAQQVKDLHNVLKPYLLRRVKEDVEKSLPPKEETIIEVALTPIQKKYYKAIYERNTLFLMKGSKPSNSPSLMNITMELRKCCNHPFLIKGAEDRIIKDATDNKNVADATIDLSAYREIFTEQLVQSSGKMVLLMKLLPKLQTGGHKVLIFSQMVKVLDLLEELMKLKNYSYERLDGSVSASCRNAAVRRFSGKNHDKFIMLLSTRAGGLGLNLTRADTVIIFDSDWNPQNDLQAMARAHRIGQTKSVHVYRLLTAKTYEMHMFHSASMKLGLDRAVLAHQRHQGVDGKSHSKKRSKESQAKEIDELLKKGAYDVFTDEDDTEARIFMETDIDMLLERNSRIVSYEKNQSSLSSGLGNFNKASFIVSDANGQDVDLDDPNFWGTLGLEYSNATQDENIILDGKKRNRKQVQMFDPYFHDEKEYKNPFGDDSHELHEKNLKKKTNHKKEGYLHESRSITTKNLNVKTIHQETCNTNLAKMIELKLNRDQVRRLRTVDPIMEDIRTGFEADSRDRIIRALLLYGFGRFCKIRHEANLSNLPLQDIEIFARTCIFYIGLQYALSLNTKSALDLAFNCIVSYEDDWVRRSIMSSIYHYELLQRQHRELRIPRVLLQSDFASKMRWAALGYLKQTAFLTRFVSYMEVSTDEVISTLGPEELSKRGCYIKDVTALDLDMKIRYLTFEEILHVIGGRLVENPDFGAVAPWWDIECDVGLLVGTVVHGLGNYRNIMMDCTLPFANKLSHQKLACKLTKSTNLNILKEAFLSAVANMTKFETKSSPNTLETNDEFSMNAVSTRGIIDIVSRYPAADRPQHLITLCKSLRERFVEVMEPDTQDGSCDLENFVSISDIDNRLYSLISFLDGSHTNNHNNNGGFNDKILQKFCDIVGCIIVRSRTVFRSNILSHGLSGTLIETNAIDTSINSTCDRALALSRRGLVSLVYLDSQNLNVLLSSHTNHNDDTVTFTSKDDTLDPRSKTLSKELSDCIQFRHAICATILCLGTHSSPKFIPVIERLSGLSFSLSQDAVNVYVEKYFIPHCVELCLRENEKDQDDNGIIFDSKSTFWPDPLESFSKHRWASREIALSILKRIKLFKCINSIVHLPQDEVVNCMESISCLKNYFPVWWTTRMSLKLLRHVGKFGLLYILFVRKEDKDSQFGNNSIESQVREFLLDDTNIAKLPIFKKLLEKFRVEDVEDFAKRQATLFPSSRVILCFLSLVANKVSLRHLDKEWAFIDLPVLDEEIFM
mmetsp:Transcript_6483/g.12211  ORF Transcript_6483/g.12211 Transcript_6483/m.12211 type:complete len:1937 (+) Transcript_6483:1878-7688(+)